MIDSPLLPRLEGALRETAIDAGLRSPSVLGHLAGGKRLRAKLVFAACPADTKPDLDRAVRYAVAIELLHAGTLCHDDLIDRCTSRRGRPTIGATAGDYAATLAGLALIWRAYELVACEPEAVRREVARAATRVARGQADETADLHVPVSVERYLERQIEKTSALFELAAWLGGTAAHVARDTLEAMVSFARYAGLAFQVVDDLRDLVGSSDDGRPAGVDLREGVYALPVLLALARDDETSATLRDLLASISGATRHDDPVLAECRARVMTADVARGCNAVLRRIWRCADAELQRVRDGSIRRALEEYAERMRRLEPIVTSAPASAA